MKVFISGGCKNGKSTIAENIAVKLAEGRPLYYMATMIPHDEEDRIRIARHVDARKDKNFITVECGECLSAGLERVLKGLEREAGNDELSKKSRDESRMKSVPAEGMKRTEDKPVFLVDAVTSLLSNRYDQPEAVLEDLRAFCRKAEDAVFVSDFIYSASEDYSEYTEIYRKGLADCDRYLAGICDVVIEICAGRKIVYKGKELL